MTVNREQVHRLRYFNNVGYYCTVKVIIDTLKNTDESQKHAEWKKCKNSQYTMIPFI